MGKHVTISSEEAADRLAIRELVEAYAHCAEAVVMRRGKWHFSLQTPHFVVYMNAKDPTPSQELHSRDALAPVFADLTKYDATARTSSGRARSTRWAAAKPSGGLLHGASRHC